MANTVFTLPIPPLKAVDNLDTTHSVSVAHVATAGGTDSVFINTIPPLKAVLLADGTYAVDVAYQ